MFNRRRSWSGEEGIALVLAMFLVLVVSLLGASLATVGRTETMSSLNYKTMSQARYAAESGLHTAANYLIYTYKAPGVDAADPLANYDVTVSPVNSTINNRPIVFTTATGLDSNYPIADKITTFKDMSHGDLTMSNSKARYTATAVLLSMRQFPDAYSGENVTIQTWQITGIGAIDGAGAADVQVSAILETQAVPAFRYAAFATFKGCDALYFAGGGTTDSYNSKSALVAGKPAITNDDGNVGTNGNLSESGGPGTVINGTLSTPRTGTGTCTDSNVTALTITGKASVKDGLVQMPQSVQLKTPATIDPPPPTTVVSLTKAGGCPVAAGAYCAASASGQTFTPVAGTSVELGNLQVNAGDVLHLNAGVYDINSITFLGNATMQIDSGPVILRVAGSDGAGGSLDTPLDLSGSTVINTSFNPQNLQIVYGGTGDVLVNGGNQTSMLLYAPNATVDILGSGDIYGSIVGAKVNDNGGAHIHYDRNLDSWALTQGNPTITSFTWSSSS